VCRAVRRFTVVDLVDDTHREVLAVAIEHEFTVADAEEPVTDLAGDVHLVEAGDRRQVTLVCRALHVPHHVAGSLRVETGHRFVGQQQRRILNQRAGDTDTLFLAAAHRAGPLVRLV
jgi:hypothetical protein